MIILMSNAGKDLNHALYRKSHSPLSYCATVPEPCNSCSTSTCIAMYVCIICMYINTYEINVRMFSVQIFLTDRRA